MALTDEQIADLEFRVEDGAEFLDAVLPKWWRRINLDGLTLGGVRLGTCGCVIQQLHPLGYFTPDDFGLGWMEATRLGFNLPMGFSDNAEQWEVLQRKWEEVILDRREGVAA